MNMFCTVKRSFSSRLIGVLNNSLSTPFITRLNVLKYIIGLIQKALVAYNVTILYMLNTR